jgi:type IV secretion system protein VirB9
MQKQTILFAFLASLAYSQNPVGAEGNPPVPPLLQQYNFGEQVKILQNPAGSVPGSTKPRFAEPTPHPAQLPNVPLSEVPLTKDVPLNAKEQEAVAVSERWRADSTPPAAGPDGRVLYSYGAGLPTVVCAPLRVCIIELQAGEKIVGEPHIGDSVRWNISPGMYGAGEQATSIIVLKPQTSGLDTNLLITTDRRAYYLRLISKPEEYVARVVFAYPEDDSAVKWQQEIAAQRTQEKLERRTAETPPAIVAADRLNFGYRIAGGNDNLRPRRVFDDGAKTYIQMPPGIQYREAPVLLVIGADGKGEMTNYRVKDQTYIVDRLFDRANLVLGPGKKAQKVEISREPKG